MKNFIRFVCIFSLSAGLLALSCARMEKLGSRYDAKECPFCTTNKGVCFSCQGNTKCSFCKGSGKRITVSPQISETTRKESTYTEVCPYCKGTTVCHYCDGTGKCWPCKGSAKIESWDFYAEHQKKSVK